jgi:putative phosphoribosyl transferase
MLDGTTVIDGAHWHGDLHAAPEPRGLVILGDGVGLLGVADRRDALRRVLRDYGLSTLAVDLPLLRAGDRPGSATDDAWTIGFGEALAWVDVTCHLEPPAIGLLGEGAAAAAVLRLAGAHVGRVSAVVTCNAQIEPVIGELGRVRAATLLIVTALDPGALEAHREVPTRLRGERRLEIIPGATPALVEPGAFETVAHLAGTWLRDHLPTRERH